STWSPETADDRVAHIYVSPVAGSSLQAAATVVHELIHAALNNQGRHGNEFKRIAKRIGLVAQGEDGQMTATEAGPELRTELEALIAKLGDFPHSRVVVQPTPAKVPQVLKCACIECGWSAR